MLMSRRCSEGAAAGEGIEGVVVVAVDAHGGCSWSGLKAQYVHYSSRRKANIDYLRPALVSADDWITDGNRTLMGLGLARFSPVER